MNAQDPTTKDTSFARQTAAAIQAIAKTDGRQILTALSNAAAGETPLNGDITVAPFVFKFRHGLCVGIHEE